VSLSVCLSVCLCGYFISFSRSSLVSDLLKIADFWASVCKAVRPMLTDRCLSVCMSSPVCLFVTLVYCGLMVGWIKLKLGMKAGLGPGHTVGWGPSSPPAKGAQSCPIFAHVCCGQTAGWIKMPPRPRPRCDRWGPSSSQKGDSSHPLFGPCLL